MRTIGVILSFFVRIEERNGDVIIQDVRYANVSIKDVDVGIVAETELDCSNAAWHFLVRRGKNEGVRSKGIGRQKVYFDIVLEGR